MPILKAIGIIPKINYTGVFYVFRSNGKEVEVTVKNGKPTSNSHITHLEKEFIKQLYKAQKIKYNK